MNEEQRRHLGLGWYSLSPHFLEDIEQQVSVLY